MAVQTATLAAMVDMCRRECFDVTSGDQQQSWRPYIVHHLITAQRALWLSHTWPFLKYRFTFGLQAAARYYDLDQLADGFGAKIELEMLRSVELIWQGCDYRLDFGIEARHYAEFNPDLNERSSPAQRWDIVAPYADAGHYMEIWPVPDVSEGTVLVTANRPLKAFAEDTDVSTLDALLVVKFAAAALLAHRKAPNAERKGKEASAMLDTLRIGSSFQSVNGFSFAGNMNERSARAPGRLIAPRT